MSQVAAQIGNIGPACGREAIGVAVDFAEEECSSSSTTTTAEARMASSAFVARVGAGSKLIDESAETIGTSGDVRRIEDTTCSLRADTSAKPVAATG